jgi:hypothetical protein
MRSVLPSKTLGNSLMRLVTLSMLAVVLANAGCTQSSVSTSQTTSTAEALMEDPHQLEGEWPFRSPQDLAVITLDRILDGRNPILYVTHDEDDGGWQFLDGDDVSEEDARVVGLAQMAKHDPTIRQLADLPIGWYAVRESLGGPWQRSPRR